MDNTPYVQDMADKLVHDHTSNDNAASLVHITAQDNQAIRDSQPHTAQTADLTITNHADQNQQTEVERAGFRVGGAIAGAAIGGALAGEALFGRPYYPYPVPPPYNPYPPPYGGPYYPQPPYYPLPVPPIVIGPGWGHGHGGWHGGRRH